MLKVNSGDSLFNSFIRSYNAYQQYKFLHITGDTSTLDRIIVNSTDADAIPVFDFRDRYNIAVSPHQTIIINAGMEGSFIFQLNEFPKTVRLPMPKNKKFDTNPKPTIRPQLWVCRLKDIQWPRIVIPATKLPPRDAG